MLMIDSLRTLMRIRRPRQLLRAGLQPALGSNIVNGSLRMRLKHPMSAEQWYWLAKMGWRTIDMRENRRKYQLVADEFLQQLLNAESTELRAEVHACIMQANQEQIIKC
jgi:hypothetical protein